VGKILLAADLAAESILPRRCVVCGDTLGLGSIREPLCRSCARAIAPMAGERCGGCGTVLVSERGRCMRCRDREWAFDLALPLFEYRGAFRSLLKAYKFQDRRSLAPLLADFLDREIGERWPDRAIIPVPPRPGKAREKGWDQVEELACALSRRGRDLRRVLERLPSQQQKRLGLEARSENARSSYRLLPGAAVPSRLVLIDDVITTGATVDACARALRAGGARQIAVLALAVD
jgi:competence protein ComFC